MALRPGEEILRDSKPFCYYVNPRYRKIVCGWCLKMRPKGIGTCSKCKFVSFCNKRCQEEAWKSHHKLECKYLQKMSCTLERMELSSDKKAITEEDFCRVLAIILKLKNNGGEEFFQLPDGKKRYYATMSSHAEDITRELENAKELIAGFKNYHQVFELWLGNIAPTFNEYVEIQGKWILNSTFLISNDLAELPTIVGRGLYLGLSCLNHSCTPNATVINLGKEIVVRAIEDVENFSTVRIEHNIDVTKNSRERKRQLKKIYHSDCKCERCEDPNSDAKFKSLKCKRCSGWVYESTKICSQCNQKSNFDKEELAIIEKYKNGTLPIVRPTMTVETIGFVLTRYAKIFHPFHEIFRKFSDQLGLYPNTPMVSCICDPDSISIELEARKLFIQHFAGHNLNIVQLGAENLNIANICRVLELYDQAEFYLKEAEEIFKVSLDNAHPYMYSFLHFKMNLHFALTGLK